MTATDQILFGLARLAAVLRAGQWQAGAAHDLNPTQVEILTRVASLPLRPAALADHLGVSAASTSDSIKSLQAKGYVTRLPDPTDGRAVQIAPTEQGRAIAAQLAQQVPLSAALDTLSATDQGAVLRALTQVIQSLQTAGTVPTQRLCATCRYFRRDAHADPARPHHCDFVNAAFGDAELRLDCGEHEKAKGTFP